MVCCSIKKTDIIYGIEVIMMSYGLGCIIGPTYISFFICFLGKNGDFLCIGEYFSGKIKSSYLDDGKIIDKQVAANGAVQYTTVRQVNKYGENGIIFNEEFNTVIDASIDGMLQTNKDNTSAIAFNNSQFKDITFDIKDFVNNPYFKGKYTKENLPEEIKAALKDKDGFQFDLNDPLDVETESLDISGAFLQGLYCHHHHRVVVS